MAEDNMTERVRRAPVTKPPSEAPFAGAKQFIRVPIEDLKLPRSSHIRRMRRTLGKANSSLAPQTAAPPESDSADLLDSDFALYEHAMVDGLKIDPQSAASLANSLKTKYESSRPRERTLIADTIGAMFSALYPLKDPDN